MKILVACEESQAVCVAFRERGHGMYYELTYNGDKKEWYLDAYKKFENRVVKD